MASVHYIMVQNVHTSYYAKDTLVMESIFVMGGDSDMIDANGTMMMHQSFSNIGMWYNGNWYSVLVLDCCSTGIVR